MIPELDSQTWLLVILVAVLLFIIIYSAVKGLLKMLLLAIALSSSIVVWIFIQNKGFTLLSCVTSSPRPWMVQTLAWGAAVLVLAIFFHGMSWFAQLFSPSKKKAGVCSIMTTSLMCILTLWVCSIAVSYYGTISRVSYAHDLAEARYHGAATPEVPAFMRGKAIIRRAAGLSWLESIDPLESAVQSNLACLVAYGCSLTEEEYTQFYAQRLAGLGIPHSLRFLDLFADAGLRKLVQEGRFVALLENDRLNTFLHYNGTAEYLKNIDDVIEGLL